MSLILNMSRIFLTVIYVYKLEWNKESSVHTVALINHLGILKYLKIRHKDSLQKE
jgi:hypothetical protein